MGSCANINVYASTYVPDICNKRFIILVAHINSHMRVTLLYIICGYSSRPRVILIYDEGAHNIIENTSG